MWNEQGPERRRTLIDAAFTSDLHYVDSFLEADGPRHPRAGIAVEQDRPRATLPVANAAQALQVVQVLRVLGFGLSRTSSACRAGPHRSGMLPARTVDAARPVGGTSGSRQTCGAALQSQDVSRRGHGWLLPDPPRTRAGRPPRSWCHRYD